MHRIVIGTFLALSLVSCGRGFDPSSGTSLESIQGGSDPVILASTTVLADITRNIAGDRLRVASLLPVGADPHSYQPVPQDVTRIAESGVLILNGMAYENFIEGLLESAGGERILITASNGLETRHMADALGEEETGEGEVHEAGDPHMWLNPILIVTYVENIREGLTHFDPDGASVYRANADAYVSQLRELDAWIIEQVGQIPAEDRLLVTNHEALGYFADRYGFTVVGTVIESFSTNASPSAKQMADLIGQIDASGALAIFLDASDNPAIPGQIAAETGVAVITDLHLESLTDGPPAGSYLEMMKYNVTRIVNVLK